MLTEVVFSGSSGMLKVTVKSCSSNHNKKEKKKWVAKTRGAERFHDSGRFFLGLFFSWY